MNTEQDTNGISKEQSKKNVRTYGPEVNNIIPRSNGAKNRNKNRNMDP